MSPKQIKRDIDQLRQASIRTRFVRAYGVRTTVTTKGTFVNPILDSINKPSTTASGNAGAYWQ